MIVEGTMRNPEVPVKTAKMFKEAGYKVEVYIIAAPDRITKEGTYISRNCKQKGLEGWWISVCMTRP